METVKKIKIPGCVDTAPRLLCQHIWALDFVFFVGIPGLGKPSSVVVGHLLSSLLYNIWGIGSHYLSSM